MTLSLAVALLLAATPDRTTANAAYEKHDFDGCGAQFAQVAATDGPGQTQVTDHWNSASCFSLAKKPDRAFEQLDLALAAGRPTPAELKQDEDLKSLYSDPRWAKLLERAQAKIDAYEKSLKQPALRKELLAMIEVDQQARQAMVAKGLGDKETAAKVESIDAVNTKRMKEIVAASGWPGISQVGDDGSHAAWLLVQHADKDLAFQKVCLAALEKAKKSGDATAADWAYLVDRVAVAEKRKQTYGTQFDNTMQPRPIEDEAHVDERRKSVGLGTMAEYREQMKKMYAGH